MSNSSNGTMQHEQNTFEFVGEKWNYIKEKRFFGTKIYRSVDGLKYLRIGDIDKTKSEVTYIEKLRELDFPVPEILDQGMTPESLYYFVERSVGGRSFGDTFREEYALHGAVSDESVKSFSEIVCTFFRAQIKSPDQPVLNIDLSKQTMLPNVLEENPDLNANQLKECVRRIEDRLSALPQKFSHGDLAPRNVFKKGIIDFEYGSIAPIGHDILTAPILERFWGFGSDDKNTHEDFYLSETQISDYFMKIESEAESHGIKNFLTYRDDFILLRAIWSLAHEREQAKRAGNTIKWDFRKNILIYSIDCYSNQKPIDTKGFLGLR